VSNTVHYPLEIAVEKTRFAPQRVEHSQYTMRLVYNAQCNPSVIDGVHLPPKILAAIEAQNVRALWLDRLEPNSLASRLLPEQPDCLVTCVLLKDGTALRSVPPSLQRASYRLHTHAAILLVAAVGVLCAARSPFWAWSGALLLAWGVNQVQKLRRMPLKRFRAYQVVTPTV